MPFSVKHIFMPDEPMYARRFQENFDNIVAELNAFPISGKFKPGSIAIANITNDNVTAAKFSPNLQFDQIPKGPAATDPSHADHLSRKAYVVASLNGLITLPATGDKGAGKTEFTAATTSLEEYEYFFNDFRWIYGYIKSSDLKNSDLTTAANQSGYIGYIPFTAALAKLFFCKVAPLVSATNYTARAMVMPDYFFTTTYIHIKTSLPLSSYYGIFYMAVGRDI